MPKKSAPIDKTITQTIIDHYDTYDESERLKNDIGPFEMARTRELIRRFIPPPPAIVLDVGGADGVYSFWLAGSGYETHLVDITPRHIESAQAKAAQPGSPQLASAQVGDGRALEFADNCAHVVMLHGPLYHLTTRNERVQVLSEARRVLQPGGVALAFGITRYAGLIYGLLKGYVFDPHYQKMIRTEVTTGLRQDPPDWLFTFPNAYFHLPDELESEVEEAGLSCEGVFGIIGPAWMVPDLERSWQDPDQRAVILEIARMIENEPALGPRLLAVGRKG